MRPQPLPPAGKSLPCRLSSVEASADVGSRFQAAGLIKIIGSPRSPRRPTANLRLAVTRATMNLSLRVMMSLK